MLQFILAIAVLFPVRWHREYTVVGQQEAAWPQWPASPRERDKATCLADRALCGIDMPLVL
jgi:hypothetical protein